MRNNTTEQDRVVVLTDTLSLFARLRLGFVRQPWVETVCNIKAVFHTAYIPGHAGIWYNEIADQLAAQRIPLVQLNDTPVTPETE